MTINNDQHYINKVLGGDTNSFAFLVEKYKDMVFTLALKINKSREEAEEVSQDTFIKAFKSLKNFKGDSKFSTWVYKIAYNNCMDRIKKNSRRYHTDAIDEVVENRIRATEDTMQSIERKERAELMNISNCTLFLRSATAETPFSAAIFAAPSSASRYRLTSVSPSVASLML